MQTRAVQVNLVATFTPNCDRAVNFNIACRVRGKPTPLSINVKVMLTLVCKPTASLRGPHGGQCLDHMRPLTTTLFSTG